MSDIQRFIIYGPCVYTPAVDGEWIRYDDHRAEVERLREERDEARAELLAHCASVADEVEATAETWGGKDAAAEMARRIRALMEGTR
jgi:hypothetical protein